MLIWIQPISSSALSFLCLNPMASVVLRDKLNILPYKIETFYTYSNSYIPEWNIETCEKLFAGQHEILHKMAELKRLRIPQNKFSMHLKRFSKRNELCSLDWATPWKAILFWTVIVVCSHEPITSCLRPCMLLCIYHLQLRWEGLIVTIRELVLINPISVIAKIFGSTTRKTLHVGCQWLKFRTCKWLLPMHVVVVL